MVARWPKGLSQALAPLQAFWGCSSAPWHIGPGCPLERGPHWALMAAVAPDWCWEVGLVLGTPGTRSLAGSWVAQVVPVAPKTSLGLTSCPGARMGHPVPA